MSNQLWLCASLVGFNPRQLKAPQRGRAVMQRTLVYAESSFIRNSHCVKMTKKKSKLSNIIFHFVDSFEDDCCLCVQLCSSIGLKPAVYITIKTCIIRVRKIFCCLIKQQLFSTSSILYKYNGTEGFIHLYHMPLFVFEDLVIISCSFITFSFLLLPNNAVVGILFYSMHFSR